MRVGQKNPITRRWASRGTRPSAPKDQRTASVYLFGAICPALGKGAAIVMPRCNTEAMALHLEEIAGAARPGAHAVVLLDQAGWHTTEALTVPPNITLMPPAPTLPGAEPCRERLAVHPRQLAVQQDLQDLQRHPRSRLRSMEQSRRSAMAHHDPRPP